MGTSPFFNRSISKLSTKGLVFCPPDGRKWLEPLYALECALYRPLRAQGKGVDNPTIGLLICKEKDKVQAQYALESSTQPISISEYELEKFYPEKVEGTMPSIEEIEKRLCEVPL